MQARRVVVTGLGALSPLGLDVDSTWAAVKAGKSGIGQVTKCDLDGLGTTIAGEVKGFDVSTVLSPKEARRLDEFIHFAIAATAEALTDSRLVIEDHDPYRLGVAVGSGIGGLTSIMINEDALRDGGPRKISPFFIPGAIINMAPGYVSMLHKLKGPNISIVSACTTAAHNIGYAARTIAYGDADVMVAGGAEMATNRLGLGGFGSARALSKNNDNPEQASRPWDKNRDGFVLGEGAAILILEEYEHAKARGATIYAEIAGFGMSADAYHMTSPQPDGMGFTMSMRNAIKDAGISPEQIAYVNAHGTSTPVGDVIEAQAIKTAFGDHAYNLCVSSTKSMTGHLLGAAGAIESIFCIKALQDQIAPPTINLDEPDEGCDLDFVAHKAKERPMQYVLNNSFGFGGTNASVVFKKFDE